MRDAAGEPGHGLELLRADERGLGVEPGLERAVLRGPPRGLAAQDRGRGPPGQRGEAHDGRRCEQCGLVLGIEQVGLLAAGEQRPEEDRHQDRGG